MHRYVMVCAVVMVFAGGCGKSAQTAEPVKGDTRQAKDESKTANAAQNPVAVEKVPKRLEDMLSRRQAGWWSAALDPETASHRRAIPYVPTRHDTVKDMLWLAEVGPEDVVYDLGSGDGRIVIAAVRDFGARKAVGIEIKPELIEESRANAAKAGVADKVEFVQGDLFTTDFSQASVVVLYLSHAANLELRAKLIRTLKPGSRVVSHQYGMGEWPAEKVLDARTTYMGMWGVMDNQFENNPYVPDFGAIGKGPTHDVVSVWTIPAPVAGVWRGIVRTESGGGVLTLTLHQRISGVSGTFELANPASISGRVWAELSGDHLECWCTPTGKGSRASEMRFEGRVSGDTLSGNLRMPMGQQEQVAKWTGLSDNLRLPQGEKTQVVKWAGQRVKAELTGTWEWTSPNGSPVQLKIERRDGQLTATYTDPNRRLSRYEDAGVPIPITDIYDFGGGFYFTLLIGRDGGGVRVDSYSGWLIGEAVADESALRGTISFYPYQQDNFDARILGPSRRSVLQNGSRDWQAKRKKK